MLNTVCVEREKKRKNRICIFSLSLYVCVRARARVCVCVYMYTYTNDLTSYIPDARLAKREVSPTFEELKRMSHAIGNR